MSWYDLVAYVICFVCVHVCVCYIFIYMWLDLLIGTVCILVCDVQYLCMYV